MARVAEPKQCLVNCAPISLQLPYFVSNNIIQQRLSFFYVTGIPKYATSAHLSNNLCMSVSVYLQTLRTCKQVVINTNSS